MGYRVELERVEIRSAKNQTEPLDPASQQLPQGYLFPGANPRQCLTPENAYTLVDTDILMGLDWIRSKTPPHEVNDPIRYFLMPTCFQWLFEQNSQSPQINSIYEQMQHILVCLLKDARENSKIPVIIAGILNLDKNHYINYFCVWNPKEQQVEIYILDPSAEKEKGSKKARELLYAEIIKKMLMPTFQNSLCFSFLAIQQIREKDCGFLCLQNLEDLFIRRTLASLTDGGMVCFDLRGLSVYGNTGRIYVESEEKYAYRSQILDQDLAVRGSWANRMMGEPSAPVRTFRIWPLKQNPTLAEAIEFDFDLEPYNYLDNVKQQFDNDILGQARSTICALFQDLRVRGENVLDACVAQYTKDFVLPSPREIAEYTHHLRKSIKPIEVQGRVYNVDDLDQEFGSLEYVVYDSILDLLQSHHATALLVRFGQFFRSYQWKTAVDWKAKIIDDFFASEDIQHILKLLKPAELSTIKEQCNEVYKDDLDLRFLMYMTSQFPTLVRAINARSSADSLFEMLEQYSKFSVEQRVRKTAINFQSKLRDAILVRARALLTHAMPQMVSILKNSLFSEDVPLTERLRMMPSRWRSRINSDPVWHGFVEKFPNTTKPFLEQIDQQIEVFIFELLDQSIQRYIGASSCETLSVVGQRDSSRDLLWQQFSQGVLRLKAGVEVPARHQEYYLKRFVAVCAPEVERLLNTERQFNSVIQHLRNLSSVCAGKIEGFDEFHRYLGDLLDGIVGKKTHDTTHEFKIWIDQTQRACLAKLNPLLKKLIQHFELGCVDPHHITYVLRPILAQLFNISVQRGNRAEFYIIHDIEEMTHVDISINRCLSLGLRQFPAVMDSDLQILPVLSTVKYADIQQLQAVHLISMIHIIDSDLYKANSFSFWFSHLKPLRNALISVLEGFRLGPDGSDILIPAKAFELAQKLLNQAYKASLGLDNTPATQTLSQLLTALRRHAGLDRVEEGLERSQGL